MQVFHKGVNITELVSKITWSGSLNTVARKVEFEIAVSPTDYYLPTVTILMGDMIDIRDKDNKLLFRGHVFSKSKSTTGTMTVTTYDYTIYLVKNKGTYNFKKLYPKQITERICRQFGVTIGKLANPGDYITRIFENVSLYDIIMTAYSISSNLSGTLYHANYMGNKFNVVEVGSEVSDYVISEDSNIYNSSYSESIENMVNRIKLYDDKGKYKGVVENKNDIKKYGVLQSIYKGKDYKKQKGNLKGLERSAKIDALGDPKCVAGNAIYVKESYTGLTGKFYIISDTHTFENNIHKMSLDLSFVKMMDTKEAGSRKKEG